MSFAAAVGVGTAARIHLAAHTGLAPADRTTSGRPGEGGQHWRLVGGGKGEAYAWGFWKTAGPGRRLLVRVDAQKRVLRTRERRKQLQRWTHRRDRL
ncbi:hypothetical protein [Streptomyces sp. NPDC127119]|uniref:hypothetical protein n=1 Tax=Streptomyces sp. NPDC127119 TaxID=3345370 RepID=UPI0036319447